MYVLVKRQFGQPGSKYPLNVWLNFDMLFTGSHGCKEQGPDTKSSSATKSARRTMKGPKSILKTEGLETLGFRVKKTALNELVFWWWLHMGSYSWKSWHTATRCDAFSGALEVWLAQQTLCFDASKETVLSFCIDEHIYWNLWRGHCADRWMKVIRPDSSVFVLADIPIKSARRLFNFHIETNIYRIKVSRKIWFTFESRSTAIQSRDFKIKANIHCMLWFPKKAQVKNKWIS